MKLFVNDLTVMDFSYLCSDRGMVGESWIVDILLDGGLNDESMVQDFGIVKKEIKRLIDVHLDHKLVVPIDSFCTSTLSVEEQDRVRVDFCYKDEKHIHLFCPPEAFAFIYSDRVDKQSVTQYLKEIISIHLPNNVSAIDIYLRDEVIDTPFYHYTHGLKKHSGNCQRIAHGHRSKILVYENGIENNKLQKEWAERWKDVYVGTQEDIIQSSEMSCDLNYLNERQYFFFSYQSSQGQFELAIPKKACDIIQTDSTVECLAQYIHGEIKKNKPNSVIEVRAFEGVGKGAIYSD